MSQRPTRSLGLERLETRFVPASVSLKGSTIQIRGDDISESCTVSYRGNEIQVTHGPSGSSSKSWTFPQHKVSKIDYEGRGGHDRFDNMTVVPAKCKGGSGDDVLIGGRGNDDLSGDSGSDKIYGRTGNDKCHGGHGNDEIHGDAGKDECHGNDGHDTIYGGDHNDKCHGGDGHDKMWGGHGDDEMSGGSGDDWMNGEAGKDKCDGGSGRDTGHWDHDAELGWFKSVETRKKA